MSKYFHPQSVENKEMQLRQSLNCISVPFIIKWFSSQLLQLLRH